MDWLNSATTIAQDILNMAKGFDQTKTPTPTTVATPTPAPVVTLPAVTTPGVVPAGTTVSGLSASNANTLLFVGVGVVLLVLLVPLLR
jgi:hypothetical protein